MRTAQSFHLGSAEVKWQANDGKNVDQDYRGIFPMEHFECHHMCFLGGE